MAVFRQELQWSTYQDKQLNILKSLERSFEVSLRNSERVKDLLQKSSVLLESMLHANNNVAKNISDLTKELIGYSESFNARLAESSDNLNIFRESIEEASEEVEEHSRTLSSSLSGITGGLRSFGSVLTTIGSKFLDLGTTLDSYQESSNVLIRSTGAGLSDIQNARKEIIGIISDLNEETGGFFSPTDAYRTLVAASNDYNVGDLETLKAISRPLLLAQNSMNGDVQKLTEILTKFYIRYNFSSGSMESMVNNILSYTANNQANAADVTAGLAELSDEMAIWSAKTGGSLEDYTNDLTKALSWRSSLGLDTENATSWIDKMISGEHYWDSELRQLLATAGISMENAQSMARGGQYTELIEALTLAEAEWGKRLGSDPAYAKIAEAYGLDPENLERALAATAYNDAYVAISEFAPEQLEATENLEDQFVDYSTRLENKLQELSEKLTGIQTYLGDLSVQDVAAAAILFKTVGGLLKTSFGSGGLLAATGGLASALGIAGAGLGIYLLVDHFWKGYKTRNKIDEYEEGARIDIKDAYDQGLYSGVDEDGNVFTTKNKSEASGTLQNIIGKTEEIQGENKSWLGKASDWIAVNIFGKKQEGIDHGLAFSESAGVGYESILRNLALDDERYKRIIDSYEKAGLLKKDWQWEAIATNLVDVGKALDAGELIVYKSKLFGSGYKEKDRVPAYAEGSNYIPYDQLALVHEGEAIIPKEYNPYANTAKYEPAHVEIDEITESNERSASRSSEYYRETIHLLKEVRASLNELREIREYLDYWRNDNIRREKLNKASRATSPSMLAVSRYMIPDY